MFIGHFAVGFASKRFAPETSLGTLIAAAVLLDLLWPVFVLLGWERVQIDPGNTAFTRLGGRTGTARRDSEICDLKFQI